MFKVFAVFFILGLLLFANSMNNDFLMDDFVFLSNPVMSQTKFISSQWDPYREKALGVVDSYQELGYYRPLTHVLYDVCYSTFKNKHWQYHLLNLLLFVLASSLVYLLVEMVSKDRILAFLTGFLYLIHPLNGIIVNYASAGVFALQVVCTLICILLLLGALERNQNRLLYFLSLFFCFLSLFWNESGIMTPFYVSAAVMFFRKEPARSKAFVLLPYFLIVFLYLAFMAVFMNDREHFVEHLGQFPDSWTVYLAGLFQVFGWYISRLVYPRGVVMQWASQVSHPQIVFGVGGLCGLAVLFCLLYRWFSRGTIGRFAVVWFLIGLVPVTAAAFLKGGGAQIEPHWMVVSSIGFFILAAYVCLQLLGRMNILGAVLLFAVVFFWSTVSYTNNRLWADQRTYALYWSQQVPGFKPAYFYVAKTYQDEGDLMEAVKYYKMSLSGRSQDMAALANLAEIDISQRRLREAKAYCRMILSIDPNSANAYNALATIADEQGRGPEAAKNYARALGLDPFLLGARRGLAIMAWRQGQYRKAVDLCLKNLDIKGDDLGTLFVLLSIFVHQKDLASLDKYTHRVLDFETDPRLITDLGVFMSSNHVPGLALDCFKKSITVAPDYGEAYLKAGSLLVELGKHEEAMGIWRAGAMANPTDVRFQKFLH